MMYAVASTGQMPGAGMQVLSLLILAGGRPAGLWRRWKLVDRNQAAMLGLAAADAGLVCPAGLAAGPEQGPEALLAVMALVWMPTPPRLFCRPRL